MDTDADDPVIKECNVYLSQELADGLYILHYPLRPKARPEPIPDSGRYRPRNEMLEFTYQLPHDYHYDIAAPEQQRIENIKLVSTRQPDKANYALGLMRDGNLHLTPVRTTLYMRPDLTHMNKNEDEDEDEDEEGNEEEDEIEDLSNFSKKVKRTRPAAGSSKKNATPAEDGSSAAGPARAKALTEVHVEYSKKTADDPFRGPRNYTELQAIINDEPWIPVEVHSAEEPASQNAFKRLACQQQDKTVPIQNPSSAYTTTLKKAAAAIYPDSATDPEWKSLASPNYPGRVDDKRWIELRKLRQQVKEMGL